MGPKFWWIKAATDGIRHATGFPHEQRQPGREVETLCRQRVTVDLYGWPDTECATCDAEWRRIEGITPRPATPPNGTTNPTPSPLPGEPQ